MHLKYALLFIVAATACGGAPPKNEPFDPDMASTIDRYESATGRLEMELNLLADPVPEHIRKVFILPGPKGKAQLRAMLLVDLDRAIVELTAKSDADPFSLVEWITRTGVDIARRAAVTYAPERVAKIDELIERAAKIHDERAAAVGEGRPVAYRFHVARAMLIRRAGSLPNASHLVAPLISVRMTVEGKKCPAFADALAKAMTSIRDDGKRTIEAKVTLERCNVRFSERKDDEPLTWEEKVNGGIESVVTRSRELCPVGRDEQGTAWCRLSGSGSREVCPREALNGCYQQPTETVERQVVKTVPRSGKRTKVQTFSTIELGGTWSASFAGKSTSGKFAEPNADWGGIFINAPALGTHPALSQPVPSADEILATRGIPEVQRIVGTAAYALADADVRVDAASSSPDDVEEATLRRILAGAAIPADLKTRYGLTDHWPVRGMFYEVRNGETVH